MGNLPGDISWRRSCRGRGPGRGATSSASGSGPPKTPRGSPGSCWTAIGRGCVTHMFEWVSRNLLLASLFKITFMLTTRGSSWPLGFLSHPRHLTSEGFFCVVNMALSSCRWALIEIHVAFDPILLLLKWCLLTTIFCSIPGYRFQPGPRRENCHSILSPLAIAALHRTVAGFSSTFLVAPNGNLN